MAAFFGIHYIRPRNPQNSSIMGVGYLQRGFNLAFIFIIKYLNMKNLYRAHMRQNILFFAIIAAALGLVWCAYVIACSYG